MLNSYLDLNFDVVHAANPDNRYADGDDIRLVNLCPIALFSSYKLTYSSGKHLEDFSHALIVSLMYKLITSSKDSDDLSIGFDRRRDRRIQELTNVKNIEGKYHLRIMLKDVSGFAEYQEKATSGLGFRLTLTINTDYAVLNKANAIDDAKIKNNSIGWNVPHYTPGIQQQAILTKQILSKSPTELQYIERSFFIEEVKNQKVWNFQIGVQEGMSVPIWIIIGFQQKDRENDQNLDNDSFCRLPVTSDQCIIGTEKYPDSAILLNYNDDDYSQGYGQIEEVFNKR